MPPSLYKSHVEKHIFDDVMFVMSGKELDEKEEI